MLCELEEYARCFWRYPDCMCKEGFLAPPPLKVPYMKTIIHVNQHNIRHNSKNPDKKPVLSIKTYKETILGNEVEIDGPSKIVYSPDKPLSCGAKVWIETHAKVTVKD